MKAIIVGYGKMGREVEVLMPGNGFELIGKYDVNNPIQSNLKDVPDVAIEFSTPHSVIDNIAFLSSKGIPIVTGTTGWYDKADYVKQIIEKNHTGLIYASNFSIGVNIFFGIVNYASKVIDKFEQYGITVEETHHIQKLDKPSGTAIRTAEFLINNINRKNKFTNDSSSPENDEIDIVSRREGSVVGVHKVFFDSPGDTITIEHNAKSRRGFAEGALLAAKFIKDKKGFYKFEDIFNNLI